MELWYNKTSAREKLKADEVFKKRGFGSKEHSYNDYINDSR